ncbi:hypothetical protein [Carboxylicivirga marina]|uniref:Uncharacterized protein n=1 Tax=Carboxylicivirga marina TaxID=2800988 RepID=A0ABS1HJN3_9BACT|nr:hypothetical protein [Carboxylicivirga marina]MBK3517841.1 hypothetical protein [Carboxylicivirga marina]
MKEKTDTLQDIKVIRQMMEQSSKFLSLSGLSGVAAGVIALLGAAFAYFFVLEQGANVYDEYMQGLNATNTTHVRLGLLLTALGVLVLAIVSAWYFSWIKARRANEKLWSPAARMVTLNLSLILTVGGVFSLILVYHENIRFVASVMLIFYGLALLMASRYTQRDIQYLAITEIALGLLAGVFLNYGIVFWSLGFGVFHIIYGISMYIKYDR